MLRFTQVDVFSTDPFGGNPVAVVHDAAELTDDEMRRFARWTNLSETTFLLPPTDPAADYRVRIFTPAEELPFAGHPTLGTCRAWLDASGSTARRVVQECGIGLVDLHVDDATIAFDAPALRRFGEPDAATLAAVLPPLGLTADEVIAASWVDNGPPWLGLLLRDAETVLGLTPDFAAFGETIVGVIGAHAPGGPADYEVRAFCPQFSVPEDPVTGSLNAGLGVWLIGAGLAPDRYVAAQGTVLGRSGRVAVERVEGGGVRVGGAAVPRISGTVAVG